MLTNTHRIEARPIDQQAISVLRLLFINFLNYYEKIIRVFSMVSRHAPRPGISGSVIPGSESVQ